jgi:hypothetical protein
MSKKYEKSFNGVSAGGLIAWGLLETAYNKILQESGDKIIWFWCLWRA